MFYRFHFPVTEKPVNCTTKYNIVGDDEFIVCLMKDIVLLLVIATKKVAMLAVSFSNREGSNITNQKS